MAIVFQIEAVWLELMYLTRPSLGYVVEQPSGSWGLKQTFIVAVAALLNLNLVCIHDLYLLYV